MKHPSAFLVITILASSLIAPACVPMTPGKPSIILASPPHGSEFREGENVVVQSAVSDAVGVTRVELFVDGALVRSDSAPSPQTYFNIVQNWKATQGKHTISVRAYNTAGVASDPGAVSVSVLPAMASLPGQTLAPTPPSIQPTSLPPPPSLPKPFPTATRVETCTSSGVTTQMGKTLYEDAKEYSCDLVCWRTDGKIDNRWEDLFPDIHAKNPATQSLHDSIGLPTEMTIADSETWSRTQVVWAWLNDHVLEPTHPNYSAARNFLHSASETRWYSINDLAYSLTRYGGLAWGTCMSRAQILTTLLYRVGVPPDRVAIAETRWKPEYSQHMYTVLKVGCRWYYLDPTCIGSHPVLGDSPENAGGCVAADYAHPNRLYLLPGSTLRKPMLVR